MPPLIDKYSFGRLVVDGEVYKSDIIVSPAGVREWWRKSSHRVTPEDLAFAPGDLPALVVFGTGMFGRMVVTPEAVEYLRKQGVEFVMAATAKAIDLYNQNRANRPTAACLHLTC